MPATCTRKVLLIEDNKDIRDSIEILLKMDGHTVEMAKDGRQGVYMALASRPDIALIDIGLPILNGYEVAKEIRRKPDGAKMVLVALTGYAQAEDKQRAIEAGFDAHLTKPVDADDPVALLNNLEKFHRVNAERALGVG